MMSYSRFQTVIQIVRDSVCGFGNDFALTCSYHFIHTLDINSVGFLSINKLSLWILPCNMCRGDEMNIYYYTFLWFFNLFYHCIS
jgi:hypothetical protein